MIDKKIECDIKILRGFLEFWSKFHSIYSNVVSKEIISKEEESKFLETKALIKSKYDELKGRLGIKYSPRYRPTDPVSDLLKVDSIRLMAEKNLKKVQDDWRDSYIFLNGVLERLENNKRRLEQFNPTGVFIKRFFEVRFIDRLREVMR